MTTQNHCPTCGAGPFPDGRTLSGCVRSHRMVRCDVCGAEIGELGLGSHRAAHTRDPYRPAARRAAKAAAPKQDPTVAALDGLVRRAAGADAAERLAKLVAGLSEFPPGAFVVVSAGHGPHLTTRHNVAGVVESFREAVVVIPVALARDVATDTRRPLR